MKTFRRDKVKPLVNIDYETTMIIVGVVEEKDMQHVVASGGYFLDPNSNLAEIAFTVDKEFRGKGITKIMIEYLTRIAQESGIDGFFGTILMSNRPMLHIIRNLRYKMEAQVEENEFFFKYKFEDVIGD